MKINRIHAVLGFLLVIIPILGLGHTIKNTFSIIAGLIILFFAIQSIHLEYKRKHRRHHRHDSFVESKPVQNQELTEDMSSLRDGDLLQEVKDGENK